MGRIIKRSRVAECPGRLGAEAEKAKADLIAAALEAAQLRKEARDEVVDLALRIAEKVIGQAVSLDPALLGRIYGEAVAALPGKAPVELRVHPADRAAGQADRIAQGRTVEVIEDETVGRGGCRVCAGRLEVDAGLPAALSAFGRAMKGERDA